MPKTKRGHHRTKASIRPKAEFMKKPLKMPKAMKLGQGVKFVDRSRLPNPVIPCCGASFELANGETVTPCRLPPGHKGDHYGTCLGSVCHWPQGFTSEEELHRDDLGR